MRWYVPLPAALPALHPAALIGTWFGVGCLRPLPGTFASLAATLLAWPIMASGGRAALLIAGAAAFLVGVWASHVFARADGSGDPSSVVIDEVAGQWLALVVVPYSVAGFACGFLAFRLYDILKPWPVDLAERALSGGLGIMVDDLVAALYAALAVALLFYWLLP